MPASGPPSADDFDRATDPSTLLHGEDPQTIFLDDAHHWLRVYEELLAMKASLLTVADESVRTMSEDAKADASFDQRLLRSQADRYRGRHEFWIARAAELARIPGTSS